jgi:hypothetical protein
MSATPVAKARQTLSASIRRLSGFHPIFSLEPNVGCCIVYLLPLVVVEATVVIGRDYFTAEAETLLELAKSAADPQVAASLTERAADLRALVDELGAAPDPSPSPAHHPIIDASSVTRSLQVEH